MALHVRERMARAGLSPRARPWRPRAAEHRIDGKRVLLTGGSSGIGRAAALRLAALGAELTLVARRADELERVRAEVAELGGTAHTISCDLTDTTAVSAMAEQVLSRWGTVDVLINNAGRSIRRPVRESLDRFHDFERTMAVNYFGAVALTLRVLPAMLDHGGGHVVNVGTWGVSAGSMPRYAAYYSSKAALTAFGASLGAELRGGGIAVTSVQYPLVRTPMSDATSDYRNLSALTPEDAAEWLVTAIRRRPDTIYPRYVSALRLIAALTPHRRDRLLLNIA